MYKVIFFILFFTSISLAQNNSNLYSQLSECKLQNIKTCEVGYLDINSEAKSFMEKFFPDRDLVKKILKDKIPKIQFTNNKPDCIIYITYDVIDVQMDNSESVSYGNIILSVLRNANIDGQDCKLYLSLNVVSYEEKVLFLNPQKSSEDFRTFFENIVTNLVNDFANEYSKSN